MMFHDEGEMTHVSWQLKDARLNENGRETVMIGLVGQDKG